MKDDHECFCGCEDAYQALFELLDGHMEEAEAQRLKEKVLACPACFQALGIEQEVRSLMKRCCGVHAPVQLRERITVAIRIEQRRR
ncbi:mycothiol system anti-sigma-R factor [Corynebacterium freiburgense]|uniref:mycothiol system anti-sigma-R factor n=1 Tax=Corynebacterium freiburgense TaxID=556548 RepID=UPI0004263833|nr:mycothiol system anti-sigma-R factor [Corynebacterium freiburgense]WJZ01936.1 Anti-sigma factor RshA [Corynebacterium freiburgense]